MTAPIPDGYGLSGGILNLEVIALALHDVLLSLGLGGIVRMSIYLDFWQTETIGKL